MPTPALVILDCDGVLVDSERITTALLAEVATELGWPLGGDDAIACFKGRDLHEVQVLIERRIGRPLGEGFLPGYRERMAARFEQRGVPAIDGAAELLDWLDARGIAHAVASNGPQEKMRLTLGRIGNNSAARPSTAPTDWFTRFEGRRFSAYDIGRWKPDPGLFLHAAEAMGAAPGSCVVVEDSISGIAASLAADMRVIGLADLTPAAELADAGATTVCASIAEVAAVLAEWLGDGR